MTRTLMLTHAVRLALVAGLVLAPRTASADEAVLRWGGDAEGGAPFVEADPKEPSVVRGFDVEVAGEIAKGLGRRARFVQVAYQSIDQSVARGDFEIGLSGVEETPGRRAELSVTLPYFEFREVITVRKTDEGKFRTLAELAGKKVGTLGGTIAYDLLLAAGKTHHLVPVSYDDDVHPYSDLLAGRLDAVVLDHIIAARAEHRIAGLLTYPEPVGTGRYVGVLAKGSAALRDQVNEVLRARMKDGTLERIYRKWEIWDDGQARHFASVLAEPLAVRPVAGAAPSEAPARPGLLAQTASYLPGLLQAAVVTISLSCLSMLLAVGLGVLIASGRVYGGGVTRALLAVYVEVMRGTPVLLQLFVLYYGLSSVVRLPAFVAALLGLGLNYAAYESEIYRGALESVPKGQLEAARTLGLTERQVLSLVRGPQAFRLALAPMTNDFVALLKDSSLVSVITVVELTKATSIFASNVGSWALPGALCAALYLLLSLPLSRLAGRLESGFRAASE